MPTPPATLEELLTTAQGLVGAEGITGARCASTRVSTAGSRSSTRQGGSLLTEDGTASAIDTEASTAAVQWYLDLFKNGLGKTAGDMGDGWCGDALGKGHVGHRVRGWLARPGDDAAPTPTSTYAWAPVPDRLVRQPGDHLVHGQLLHRR